MLGDQRTSWPTRALGRTPGERSSGRGHWSASWRSIGSRPCSSAISSTAEGSSGSGPGPQAWRHRHCAPGLSTVRRRCTANRPGRADARAALPGCRFAPRASPRSCRWPAAAWGRRSRWTKKRLDRAQRRRSSPSGPKVPAIGTAAGVSGCVGRRCATGTGIAAPGQPRQFVAPGAAQGRA